VSVDPHVERAVLAECAPFGREEVAAIELLAHLDPPTARLPDPGLAR
jgi:hypothetical protein